MISCDVTVSSVHFTLLHEQATVVSCAACAWSQANLEPAAPSWMGIYCLVTCMDIYLLDICHAYACDLHSGRGGRTGSYNGNGSAPERRQPRAYSNGAAPPLTRSPPAYQSPANQSPAEGRSDPDEPAPVQQPPSRPTTSGADSPGPSLQQPTARSEGSSDNQAEQQPGPARAAAQQEASTTTSVEEAAPVLAAAPMRPPPRAAPPRSAFPSRTALVLFAPPPGASFMPKSGAFLA